MKNCNAQGNFSLDQFLGNDDTICSLKAALCQGRLAHAVLITAPDGCGRGFFARLLAADYLYPPAADATVRYSQAVAAVINGASSEVLTVEGQGVSGQIPVESVRNVRQAIFHSSLSAEGRVVLIPQAHKMNQSSANALLKVLEEPPAHALFILCAPNAANLPATITSRCAQYTLVPPGIPLCREALQAHAQDEDFCAQAADIPFLCALYGGKLGLALKAAKSAPRLQTAKDAAALVTALARNSRYRFLSVLSAYEGRGEEERDRREWLLQDFQSLLSSSLIGVGTEELPQLDGRLAAFALEKTGSAWQTLAQNSAAKITFTALTAAVFSS